MSDRPVSYWDYIKTEQLLTLQNGLEPSENALENDEVMFIVIHQIEELWFKLAIREVVSARDLFAQEHVPETSLAAAVRGLDRTTATLRLAADHLGLMETMTTRDYLGFRDKLYPASGFQSAQLRELEILMGLKMEQRIALGHESYLDALKSHDGSPSPAYRRVEARIEDTPSFHDAIDAWLYRTPICGSRPEDPDDAAIVSAFVESYADAIETEIGALGSRAASFALTEEDRTRLRSRYAREAEAARAHLRAEDVASEQRRRARRVRAALLFIESYRELPLLAWPRAVLDSIVALEQTFISFRQRHARMVERIIGNRTGTGGSAGVAYLDRTALEYRIFKDVWATRTLLVRRDAMPPIARSDEYGFHPDGARQLAK
jgi:tryptophan 2,3-dioxygenase